MEGKFVLVYICDILLNFLIILILVLTDDYIFVSIAYASANLFLVLFQTLFFFKIFGRTVPYCSDYKAILTGSIKLKSGSVLYGTKDLFLLQFFTSLGEGYYTIFNYASKFSGIVLQVILAPILNVFASESAHALVSFKKSLVKTKLRNILFHAIWMYIVSSFAAYTLIPIFIEMVFISKIDLINIELIKEMFMLITVFNFVWLIQSPFGRIVALAKLFNYSFLADAIFALFVFLGFLFIPLSSFGYLTSILLIIIAQTFQLVFLKRVASNYLDDK